jgi:hypothetical protein
MLAKALLLNSDEGTTMNRIHMNALALAVSLGFSTGAMAESMSKADYTAAQRQDRGRVQIGQGGL